MRRRKEEEDESATDVKFVNAHEDSKIKQQCAFFNLPGAVSLKRIHA